MEELKNALKQYNLNNQQVAEILEHFNFAIDNKIPYPIYYAISKAKI
jgi:hypothetical protein